MTGLPPAVHGVRDNGIFELDAAAGTTLAERLRARGWSTAAFVSAFPLLAGFGLDRGFDHYDSALGSRADSLGGMRQRTAAETLDRLERWFSGSKAPPPSPEAPLFLWVHFFDPHADYQAPAPWPAVAPDPYRAEVAYADHETGRLLRTLRRERDRELRLVVTSDHGEGLHDHGESTHGALLHSSTIRVPIVARTEDYAPALVAVPVSLERVPATLLALLGFGEELNPGSAPSLDSPAQAVHAETLYPWFNFGWSGLWSREEGGWRLIAGPTDRLYRTAADPGELRNVAADHPEVVAAMKEALDDERLRRKEAAFPPLVRELSAEETSVLQSLGYVAGGRDGGGDLDRAFAAPTDPHDRLATVDRINLALTLLREGDGAGAADVLGAVVREEPSNRFALEHLGRALRAAGRLEEARDALRRSLAAGKNPELVYLDLAEIEGALGRRDVEEQVLTQALAVNPRSVEARTRLARILVEEKRYESALALLDEALEIRPRAPVVHFGIAQVYESLGRNEEAAAHWRRLLELDSEGRYGEIARTKLGS
jgi:tetratricopeptide (TPR) repeat protein